MNEMNKLYASSDHQLTTIEFSSTAVAIQGFIVDQPLQTNFAIRHEGDTPLLQLLFVKVFF
jgi:hypothetical protein